MIIREQKLDGQWMISLDKDNIGKAEGWESSVHSDAVKAVFPGLIQDTFPEYHWGVAWYWNRFSVDEIPSDSDALLKVGSAEFIVEYWLNGCYIGRKDSRQSFFELDCTSALKKGENLLAIRVVVPGKTEEIDGYVFEDTTIWLGDLSTNSAGGVFQPVYLVFRPKVRTERAVVRADMHTGNVEVDVCLHSGHEAQERLVLDAQILADSGELMAETSCPFTMEKGELVKSLELQVTAPHLWDRDDPYLYTLNISLLKGEHIIHQYKVNFGFREFLVKDGWFFLNGRRIFFKTIYNREGFHPRGALLNDTILYKELTQLKSMNFDSIRFHNYVPAPEILDMCDRMGILVIQAHGASWWLKEKGRYNEELFRSHLRNAMENNINHPSIVAWELQNESHFPKERIIAREALPFARELDKTRLIFLSSGRWDNEMSVGSVSNPGSNTWEHVWGAEDPNAPPAEHSVRTVFEHPELGKWTKKDDDLCCWQPNFGDVHVYPRVPMTFRGKYVLRQHGKGLKPCFISETGSAAMGEMYDMARRMEQLGFTPSSERTRGCVECVDYFDEQWDKYGLGDLYPFPNDLLLAGDKLNAYTRTAQLECLRSNPKVAGLDFSCLSGPFSGFGVLDWFGERKNYIAEAVGQCLAPLRWCVFVESEHTYQNQPFTVEAVLASEDVLKEGTYPVIARIVSMQTGCVWEHKTELKVKVGEDGYLPLSFPVFKETVSLDVPKGDYQLSVSLEHGGVAIGGRKVIHIAEKTDAADKKAFLVGIESNAAEWIKAQGVQISKDATTVLVGDMPEEDAAWEALYERAKSGATVVFLKPEAFLNGVADPYNYYTNNVPHRLPIEQKGEIRFTDNWAWRIHTVLKNHRYAKDLPIGLLSDLVYNQTTPCFMYEKIATPDEVVAVSLAAPYGGKHCYEYNTRFSGVAIGVYNYGKGKLVLNTIRILDELGKNPAADKLLLNFLD